LDQQLTRMGPPILKITDEKFGFGYTRLILW
jgi:hypothetical protein